VTQLTPEEVTRLSVRERLELIGQLWDSLADADVPLPKSQQVELERRLATFEDDHAHAVTWDQLKAELAARRR
jgi:putative addiction module component (TIGR02574 family)